MNKNRPTTSTTTRSLMQPVKATIRKLIWTIAIAFAALSPTYAQAPQDTISTKVDLTENTSSSIDAEIVNDPPVVKQNPILGMAHRNLGLLTVATGLAAGILNPKNTSRSVHEALGYTSAGLAAATMTLGAIAHHDKIGANKNSSNNIHAILGILGGSMMVLTPFFAPDEAHQALGTAGTLTMAVAVGWQFFF